MVVISQSKADSSAQRHAKIRAQTKALLDAREANTAKAPGPVGGQLSPELDGSLCREDENIVVVSQSKADAQRQRLAEARERLEARHSTAVGVPASSAPSHKPASWWRQFIFPGALIPKADATLAVRMILNELRITLDERVLDFKTDQIVQTTFCEALEKLTDSDLGWRTITQIYERELQRTDHQS
jgi:hypothetical protein